MTQKLDYSREEAMQILNSENYSDEQKKTLYEQYMSALKKNRKNEIVNKLNEYAKNIPTITKEIYISKLKEYDQDDLSKPFEVIEKELLIFENDMKNKYNEYLESQKKSIEPELEDEDIPEEITPDVSAQSSTDDFDDTIFSEPFTDIQEEVKPSQLITDQISVINEEPEIDVEPLFENAKDESKDVIIEDDEKERGNASAIILSIIAVIIGIVVMYTIIKLN